MYIAEYISEFKKSKNPYYLVRAFSLLIQEGRLIESLWSFWCIIRYNPSKIVLEDDAIIQQAKLLISQLNNDPFFLSRNNIIEKYKTNYLLKLPTDFNGARTESIVETNGMIIIGEYATASAKLIVATKNECKTHLFYQKIKGVRHIHSVHQIGETAKLLIATGDKKKMVDQWEIGLGTITFEKRLSKRLSGYTTSIRVNNVDFFGTDFSSRPNYITTLDGEKYFFPLIAYKKFTEAFLNLNNRYILSINLGHKPIDEKIAASIFDTKLREFIYCDYVSIPNISQDDLSN